MLVNGRSLLDIRYSDYGLVSNWAGSPIPDNGNYCYPVAGQTFINNHGQAYFRFRVNKDWLAAKGYSLNDLTFTLKAGMPIYGADGKIYRSANDLNVYYRGVNDYASNSSSQNALVEMPATVSKDGMFTGEILHSTFDGSKTMTIALETKNLDGIKKGGYEYHLSEHYFNEFLTKEIYINGVSVYDINKNTDYSAWDWEQNTVGWPVGFRYASLEKPVIFYFKADAMEIHIHPEYAKTLGATVDFEIKKGGYIFGGDKTQAFYLPTLEKMRVYTAKYNVTIDGATQIVEHGSTIAKPATPTKTEAGYTYTFDNWYVGDAVYDFETPVTGNLEIVSKFNKKVNEYKAIVNVNGEEKTVAYTIENRDAKLAEIIAMLPENTAQYTYAWTTTLPSELALEDCSFAMTATVNNYTVTFDVDGGSAVEAQTVPYGTPASELANFTSTKAGYTFAGWTMADGTAIPEDATVTGDITVKAVWEVDETATPETSEPEASEPEASEPNTGDPLESIKDEVPGGLANIAKGCGSVVGGVAGGIAALGLAVAALLKKKDD